MADQLWLMTRIREEEECELAAKGWMKTITQIQTTQANWQVGLLFAL